MIEYKLKPHHITNSIKHEDMPTRNSLVKIKYKGRNCLAQFSWYDVPDLVGEIWKPVTAADHKTMGVKKSAVVTQFVFFAITLGIAFLLGRQIYEFGIWWLSSVFVLLGLFVALMFFSSNLRVGLQNYR